MWREGDQISDSDSLSSEPQHRHCFRPNTDSFDYIRAIDPGFAYRWPRLEDCGNHHVGQLQEIGHHLQAMLLFPHNEASVGLGFGLGIFHWFNLTHYCLDKWGVQWTTTITPMQHEVYNLMFHNPTVLEMSTISRTDANFLQRMRRLCEELLFLVLTLQTGVRGTVMVRTEQLAMLWRPHPRRGFLRPLSYTSASRIVGWNIAAHDYDRSPSPAPDDRCSTSGGEGSGSDTWVSSMRA